MTYISPSFRAKVYPSLAYISQKAAIIQVLTNAIQKGSKLSIDPCSMEGNAFWPASNLVSTQKNGKNLNYFFTLEDSRT